MGNLLGALIGAAIVRDQDESAINGAVEGRIVEAAIPLFGPVIATFALGWTVQYAIRKAWHALSGEDSFLAEWELRTGAL